MQACNHQERTPSEGPQSPVEERAKTRIQHAYCDAVMVITASDASEDEKFFACLYFALVLNEPIEKGEKMLSGDTLPSILESIFREHFGNNELQLMDLSGVPVLRSEPGILGFTYANLCFFPNLFTSSPDDSTPVERLSDQAPAPLAKFSGSMWDAFCKYDAPQSRKDKLIAGMSFSTREFYEAAKIRQYQKTAFKVSAVSASLILGGVAAFFLWPVLAGGLALAATAAAAVAVGLAVSGAVYGLCALASRKKSQPSCHPQAVTTFNGSVPQGSPALQPSPEFST